jgi:tetratricopeptide (TPR) repeat protein
MLERYRATGPRGMTLVPHAEAHRLDGLNLPDAALYDHVYRLQRALEVHQRDRAADALAALEAEAPEHRLTFQARFILARYDADHAKFLAAVEELLRLFPQDGVFEMAKVACLGQLVRRDERLALLRAICDRKDADPVFWRVLAQELSADAREHGTAMRLLRRALRCRPADAPNFALLANILWDQRRFEEAMELYRFAACLDDKDEGLARSYFAATCYLKQHEATLAFLTRRFERFGRRSGQPARTLYWALSQFERLPEALAVLEKTLEYRPDDGELRLVAADAYAGCGDFARAEAHLAAAEGKAPPGLRLRTAANLAATRGDQKAALALWRQVLTTEPLALDANRAVAQYLAEIEGRAAAQEHLRQACARFPYHVDLHGLLIGWLRDDGAAAAEPAVRALLGIHPVNAWASRELALCLSDQGWHERALTELATARGLEPESTAYYAVAGQVYARAGQLAEARAAYREAIRRSADNDFAIAQLIELCDTHAERRAALDFIKGELVRQVLYGDGLLAFQQHAAFTLEPEELLATLEEALAARPDLWHAWSAVVHQLLAMHRRDESLPLFATPRLDQAAERARQAVNRFPLLPRLWFDLAEVCAARRDHAGEIEALNQARHISPKWGLVLRRLAEVHERDGQPAQARQVLEQAVAYAPLDCVNHGHLADLLWRQGDRPAALERIRHALRLEPGYEWAWEMLRTWSRQLGQPETAVEFARDLTRRRGGEARSWMMLADVLTRPEQLEKRLAVLDRALERNPRLADAYNLKAEALAEAGRFDAALAACRPTAWGETVPLYLRGRAAWVEAQRGDTETAIAQTRALVAEDPTYLWAWSNLADWYRARGETEPYLEAANALVRLAPHRAIAFGYRGDARWRAGDHGGGMEDFRRALDLDPTYGFAGVRLFDHYFAAGQFAQAGEVIDRLRQHAAEDEFATARAVRWAVHQEDLPAALAGVRRLCVAEDPSDWPLNYATEAIREYAAGAADRAGWAEQLDQLLNQTLALPDAHPHVATLWVERCTARKDWTCAQRFDALLKHGERGRRAVYAYLRALGQARERRRLHRFIRRHRAMLRADTMAWGLVGYALSVVDEQSAAARWLADWADRPGLQAWMLINVVLAQRALGREAEANTAGRHALTLPADATTPHHRLWLAVDAALDGETETAAKHCDGVDPQACDASHRFLHALVHGLLEVQQAAPRDRPEALRRVRRRLLAAAAACTPMPEDRQAILRTYRRCVLQLGRDAGTMGALPWACWRWLEPRIPAASGSPAPAADESSSDAKDP